MLRSLWIRAVTTSVGLIAAVAVLEGAPVCAQDVAGGGGGGDPMVGGTSPTETPTGTTGESFGADDVPPGGGPTPDEIATPTPSAPVPQYGRRDPFLPIRLDGHATLTWDGSFGFGARVDFPLISGTFRYSNRDELAISVGGDVTFISFSGSHYVTVWPTAVLQWSLGINERMFFYPELGLAGEIGNGDWKGLHPNVGFGTRYYLHRSLSFQARFGWPVAFSAGVTF